MIRAMTILFVLAVAVPGGQYASAGDDILIANFETNTYGDWTATGEAFGPGPAEGTLPGQMAVTAYGGRRLVNSFYQGDGTTGTLTSPPIEIKRSYLVFKIGGGGYAGETCVNLLLGEEMVRTATGPNTNPGGSEELVDHCWDVGDLKGKLVRIQIVDKRSGGWGHINADTFVLSDNKPKIPVYLPNQSREIKLTNRYLLFPIQTGGRMAQIDVAIGDVNVREFDAELASAEDQISYWSFLDVSGFADQEATLSIRGATEEAGNMIRQSESIPGAENFYTEPLRPQFHFSQMLGWNNDPNGMVYYDGEWHLYFQHNPYGWKWGNMHWGHAVSKDLVHWKQLPIAIYNKKRGDWAFSGGAVVDEHNTAGWQTGDEKVIVASWTSTGRGECIAYSNDRGRTFVEYEGNPVIKHQGRDPKIVWYEPGQHWVLVVYDQVGDKRVIAFHTSKDLKHWKLQSHVEGYFECPEFFELPIDGDPEDTRWVLLAADAQYAIGTFDGKKFTPEHEGKHRLHYGSYYASQTFSNAPDGRRIQIGWAQIEAPGMPFNQTFSFPHQLTLRTTDDGVRLFAQPVEEIKELHREKVSCESADLLANWSTEQPVSGELFDVRAEFEVGDADIVGLKIGEERIVFNTKANKLNEAPMKPTDGKVLIRVLVDRPMLEIIGNNGSVFITKRRDKPGKISKITAFAEGGKARLVRMEVVELESIW